MKALIAGCLTVSILLASNTILFAKKPVDNTKTVGYKYLESSFQTYDQIQKTIHGYAEPGYLEYKSSKLLADHLEQHGFKLERGVAGIPTAFVASFGEGKPVVAILGEFDALPGMSQDTSSSKKALVEGAPGHACGHNLLGTGPAAAAVAISKWLAEGHQGTVKYFGCPAEEGGGGKSYLVKAGCFKDCDLALDYHPSGSNGISMGSGLANLRVKFSFAGISAHASGSPWKGRSALDAVEAFNFMMNLMREHVTTDVRIHYIITNGGQAPNVVPNFSQVEYYFRASTGNAAKAVFNRALKAAEGAAMGTETKMSYEIINGNYEVIPNETLSEIYLKNLQKVGGVILDEREKAYCAEVMNNSGTPVNLSNFTKIPGKLDPRGSGGGSTDVGNVSQVIPVARLRTATFTSGSGGHSWQNVAVGGTTVGTKGIMVCAKVQYLTALEIYQNPSLTGQIWNEYYSVQGKDFRYKQLQGDRLPPLDYCRPAK